jgi:ParB family chromosome partitioning protein
MILTKQTSFMDYQTNSPVVLITLKNLIASKRNVRKTGGDSIDDIAASILKHGLIRNLTVIAEIHPKTKTETGKFEVVVGGRRLAALQKLSKQKKLPKSLGPGVPCQVVDSAKAVEVSLAENTLRLAMHPADQFVAFSELHYHPIEHRNSSCALGLKRFCGRLSAESV